MHALGFGEKFTKFSVFLSMIWVTRQRRDNYLDRKSLGRSKVSNTITFFHSYFFESQSKDQKPGVQITKVCFIFYGHVSLQNVFEGVVKHVFRLNLWILIDSRKIREKRDCAEVKSPWGIS